MKNKYKQDLIAKLKKGIIALEFPLQQKYTDQDCQNLAEITGFLVNSKQLSNYYYFSFDKGILLQTDSILDLHQKIENIIRLEEFIESTTEIQTLSEESRMLLQNSSDDLKITNPYNKWDRHFVKIMNTIHGQKVIKWFEEQGIRTDNFIDTVRQHIIERYYGVLNNILCSYTREEIKNKQLHIFDPFDTTSKTPFEKAIAETAEKLEERVDKQMSSLLDSSTDYETIYLLSKTKGVVGLTQSGKKIVNTTNSPLEAVDEYKTDPEHLERMKRILERNNYSVHKLTEGEIRRETEVWVRDSEGVEWEKLPKNYLAYLSENNDFKHLVVHNGNISSWRYVTTEDPYTAPKQIKHSEICKMFDCDNFELITD